MFDSYLEARLQAAPLLLQLVNAWSQVEEVLTEARALEVLGGFLSYWLVDCKLAGVKLLVRFAHDITNRFDS